MADSGSNGRRRQKRKGAADKVAPPVSGTGTDQQKPSEAELAEAQLAELAEAENARKEVEKTAGLVVVHH